MQKIRILSLAFWLSMSAPLASADQVLYQFSTWYIKDSKSGPIATFQDALNDTLEACGIDVRLNPDGVFGGGTKSAITKVTACEGISDNLVADSPAREGAITADLWPLIVKDMPAPDVGERAAALKLTFEATDYDRMQWNFCQNRPFYNPSDSEPVCYSNDRASFITWGPNGATAGHGREVQAILNAYLDVPGAGAAFDAAFESEASSVRRMLTLNHSPNGPLETYLCGVWMDAGRRSAWRDGFRTIGQEPEIKSIYREVYASQSFDGGKIKRFYDVWTSDAFGLQVTELDHAWFVDRSAHMGISKTKLTTAMTALKASAGEKWPLPAADIRRYISQNVIPSNRQKDRLGRDVAYYISGVGKVRLSTAENEAWVARGRRNAVDIGLSDDRLMAAYTVGKAMPHPMPDGTLTSAEQALCPAAVLNPQRPG